MAGGIYEIIKVKSEADFKSLKVTEQEFKIFGKKIQEYLKSLNIKPNNIKSFESLLNILKKYDGTLGAVISKTGKLQGINLKLPNLAGGAASASFKSVTTPVGIDGKAGTEVITTNNKIIQSYSSVKTSMENTRVGMQRYIATRLEMLKLEKSGQTETAYYKALKKEMSSLSSVAEKLGISFEGNAVRITKLKTAAKATGLSVEQLKRIISDSSKSKAKIIDTANLKQAQKEIQKTRSDLQRYISAQLEMSKLSRAGQTQTGTYRALAAEIASLSSTSQKLGLGFKNGILEIRNLEAAAKATGLSVDRLKQIMSQATLKHSKIIDTANLKDSQQGMQKLISQTRELYRQEEALQRMKISGASQRQIEAQKQYIAILQRTKVDINSLNLTEAQRKSLLEQLTLAQAKHNASLTGMSQEVKRSTGFLSNFGAEFKRTLKTVIEAGLSWRVFSLALQGFRKSIENVKDLDRALTEVQKVTDLAGVSLRSFTKDAFDLGTEVGRTGTEVVDATATFARAGYSVEESLDLSKVALTMTNVADGINDVGEASSSLISIMAGFKMGTDEATHALDALNEVSNTQAIDAVNLTEIMKRTAGVIAQTGTSYEELIGLGTAGFKSLRNAEMVATGINTISQRMRGMSEAGEEVEGLIPKIEAGLQKWTDGAVTMIDKQNGGLMSMFEVLSDLHEIYPQLSDEQQAYINEVLAGNVAPYVQKCA